MIRRNFTQGDEHIKSHRSWKVGFEGHSMHKCEWQPVIEILMLILCLFWALVN